MFNTIPGRLFVYSMMLAFCVACWYGVIVLISKVVA